MKKTSTKFPSGYVSAYTKPSYQDADTVKYNRRANKSLPQGKVLIISEGPGKTAAYGYYGTTPYGDIFGANPTYYILDNDDQLYVLEGGSRYPLHPDALAAMFEQGSFKPEYRDHWLNYKTSSNNQIESCDVTADSQDPYWDSYTELNDDEFKAVVDSYKQEGQGSRYTDWSIIVAELKGKYGLEQAKKLADAICYGDVEACDVTAADSICATKAYTKGYVVSDPVLTSANGNFSLVIEGGIGTEDTPYTCFQIRPSKTARYAVVDIRVGRHTGMYQGVPVINLPAKYSGEYAEVSYGFRGERTGNAWVRDVFIPILTEAVDFADEVNNYFASTSSQQLSEMCKDVFLDMGIDYDSYIAQEADSYL